MRPYEIVVDVTCDLPEELRSRYGIRVLPGHMTVPGGKELATVQRWGEPFGRSEFYAALKNDPDGFTTAPPNVLEFFSAMEQILAEGKDLVVLTISSGISGTFGFAAQAAKEARARFPEGEVRVVDTLRFGPAAGLLALQAAVLREEGATLAECADWLETNKNRYHQAGWLDDLSFVAKKGRMTNAKAFFGTLIGIKPIGEFDYNGMTTVIAKFKGAKAAYQALLYYIAETIEDPEDQIVFVAQSDREAQALQFKALIEENIRPKQVIVTDLHCACGVSVGPGLMAAYYRGKPISADLSEEKAVYERYMKKEN